LNPVIAAVLYSFEQAREDLEKCAGNLSDEAIRHKEGELAPLAFQIRHIGGAVDRLITYAMGQQLTPQQFAELEQEKDVAGATRDQLFAELFQRFERAEAFLRSLNPGRLSERREVGRKRAPTTLAGLLIHIAEHTQRHVGEAIITAKVAASRIS
jgi:uncharacterized damage-inducible protein DinB